MLVRRALRHADRALRDTIFAGLPSEDELAHLVLEPADGPIPVAGSRPQRELQDHEGRRYLFKLAPPAQIAAELLASRMRRLGGRPSVPGVRRALAIGGGPQSVGMLQPRLQIAGALAKHPRDWTPLQRESMLRQHPWEWLLANLDTHVDQYVLLGEHGVPLNIDWDHSLVDLATVQLTRFNRRTMTVMPVRNLLYSEYVAGAARVDFYGMQLEAHRIRGLEFDRIEPLLHLWADELQVTPRRRARVIEAMRLRHARIADDFDALIESLRDERYHGPGRPARRWRRMAARAQDAWQRFAVLVLHDHVVRPILATKRRLLGARSRLGLPRRADDPGPTP